MTTTSRRRRRAAWHQALLLAASLAVTGTAVAGCTSARNLLGPKESVCFRALPTARQAVGPGPTFAGVRYFAPGALVTDVERAHGHGIRVPDRLVDDAHRATCLVGYRGHFHLASVKAGWAPLRGPYLYAVVVTDPKTGVVSATVLFHRVPFRLADVFPF